MKNTLSALLFLGASVAVHAAPSSPISNEPAIIPAPAEKKIVLNTPGFLWEKELRLFNSPGGEAAVMLATALKNAGVSVVKSSDDKNALQLEIDTNLASEGYKLSVTPEKIHITAGGPSGAFYAIQTLLQCVVNDNSGKDAVPAMTIEDSPRFKWRGLMIDSCRRPRSVAEIKSMIDLMARYKFNTMHWHLTDDQGWRVEIKKYPKLTTVGGARSSTPVMGNRNKSDETPFSFSYTQEEIKEVVKYANERAITVVPEIEVPGHAAAAITAYPELGNKDIPNYKPEVVTKWGVFPYIYSPSDETFQFLDNVFEEICVLFPKSPYIHIGGDEAPKDQWNISPFAQSVIKKNDLKNSHELQSYFIRQTEKLVNKKGKKIIGWDEIQEGGLSKTAIMMVWRDQRWGKMALDNGNEIIMTPTDHCYLDYREGPGPKTPEFDTIGGNLPLKKAYELNPVPKGASSEQEARILGVQGNCWSEYMPTLAKWQYQVFPRALAIAEVGWSAEKNKNYDDFKARWDKHKPYFDELKINYRRDDGEAAQPDKMK